MGVESFNRAMPLRAILFDLDGTLTDSDALHFQAWSEELLKYNIEISHSFYRAHISGKPNHLIIAAVLEHFSCDLPADIHAHISHSKEERFRTLAASGLHRLPGLDDLFAFIQKHQLRCACVTNAPRQNAEFMLRALNIGFPERSQSEPIPPNNSNFSFECLIISEECADSKPSPVPYLTAMDILQVRPEECVVFEDSFSGVRAGVAAGSPVIGVCTSHPREALLAHGVSDTISDFTGLAIQPHHERDFLEATRFTLNV
eukprot:TRINITY_DN8566_c0_g1_i2.p1 TRINITY_DN8566_c0_g1~~TRINITY_DN8566_c0_g1_i2.p1  ORF type:complete len:268 (+),score=29.90 TRINITY_DN8566_c0_g1_i2:30-806(+)